MTKLSVPQEQIVNWLWIDSSDFDKQLSSALNVNQPVRVAKEAAAFWVYTSGSTGRPKGVIHTHFNPVVAIENYGKNILQLTKEDTILSAPPMAFSYGLGTSIYFPLFFNSKVVLCAKKSPFEYVTLINTKKVSVFFGVPHTYASIFALREIASLNINQLRLCVCAGEKLSETLWEKWNMHFGIKICEGTGTTESTHIFISNKPKQTVAGSTGVVVPGYRARLLDETGHEVAANTPGMLEISGEGFMRAYWNKLKETQRVLQGQTMLTGDIYRRDHEGNYYFMGRKDGFIKVKGIWISPMEIEQTLLKHPTVAEAIVVIQPGVIDDSADITAYLKLDKGNQPTQETHRKIKSFLKTQLPKFKLPKKIKFVNTFPRTATGKINRNTLREITINEEESV
jgi:acyl-coenzyme A synthetase/AMP-(fatty) acid ligase